MSKIGADAAYLAVSPEDFHPTGVGIVLCDGEVGCNPHRRDLGVPFVIDIRNLFAQGLSSLANTIKHRVSSRDQRRAGPFRHGFDSKRTA